jgi:hypothetical protein
MTDQMVRRSASFVGYYQGLFVEPCTRFGVRQDRSSDEQRQTDTQDPVRTTSDWHRDNARWSIGAKVCFTWAQTFCRVSQRNLHRESPIAGNGG